jgi:uncharacterized 2Fe-2S/4Fe-4S cluster protein (DUF4445 family)
MSKNVSVNFINRNKTVNIEAGSTILDAARLAGIVVESPCNGIGTCGKCKVFVKNLKDSKIVTKESRHKLSDADIAAGYVLACQTAVYEDTEVETIDTASHNKSLKILSEGQSFVYAIKSDIKKKFDGKNTSVYIADELVGSEDGDTESQIYGLSVDIGTTTVVVALINVITGEEITSASALNPQSLYAQDVLTRIKFASNADGLKIMFDGITEEINKMIKTAAEEAGINPLYIYEVVYSGNTTMIHLACNTDPSSIGRYPYTPVLYGGNTVRADILNISPFGLIYLPPIISSYVGPDITSGVLAAQLAKKDNTTLFIDIGTNGEMVMTNKGKMSATSTAAGPAFEGMNITCGMRAGNGALELFEIDDDYNVSFNTIGGAEPTGICGSGLLDIVGELVNVGIIGANGKFVSKDKHGITDEKKLKLLDYIEIRDGKPVFKITDNIFLSQKDVREVQLAKGAVRAGIEALMLSLNISVDEVDEVEIAGSFGYHLREKSLINIGLLPRDFEGKVSFVGNTSKTGGKAFLLNTDFRAEFVDLVNEIDSVELSNRDDFQKIFVNALNFK